MNKGLLAFVALSDKWFEVCVPFKFGALTSMQCYFEFCELSYGLLKSFKCYKMF